MRYLYSTLPTLLLIASSYSSTGQTILTLEECVTMAVERNLDVRRSHLNTEFTRVDLKEERMSRLPSLNLSTNLGSFSGFSIDPTTNTFNTETFIANDVNLTTFMTLFAGGRINNRIERSRLQMRETKAREDQTVNDVALNVALSFLDVLSGKERLKNARAQLELTREQVKDLENMIRVGNRAANDMLDLEVQLSQAEQEVQQAENDLSINKLALAQIMRWEGDDFDVQGPDLDDYRDLNLQSYTLVELYNRALETQPIVKAQELAVEASQTNIKVAQSAYYPTLSLNGFLSTRYSDANISRQFEEQWIPLSLRIDDMPVDVEILQTVPTEGGTIPVTDQWNQNFGYGARVTLDIPLYNRHSVISSVQRAKVSAEIARADLEATKDQLRRDVENAFVAARNAEKFWQATQRSENAAQAAYENARKKYNLGNATNLELTTARVNFENAQRDNLAAKYSYIFNVKVLDYYIGKDLNF